jgi:hypothetical protein
MAKNPVVLKLLCAAFVGCLMLPLGGMVYPYLDVPALPFTAIEAAVRPWASESPDSSARPDERAANDGRPCNREDTLAAKARSRTNSLLARRTKRFTLPLA